MTQTSLSCSVKVQKNRSAPTVARRLPLLQDHGRVERFDLAAGSYDSSEGANETLPTPPEHRFFLVFEWNDEQAETTQRLAEWIKSGQLKYRESIAVGLDSAVAAFRGMLRGENFGKQLVKIADE